MEWDKNAEQYKLSSGRIINAHEGVLGIPAGGNQELRSFSEGWDGINLVDDWTPNERGELAEAMAEAWARWGGLRHYWAQPLGSMMSNGDAASIGHTARSAGTTPNAGDDIDRGLILVRLLREAGYLVLKEGQP